MNTTIEIKPTITTSRVDILALRKFFYNQYEILLIIYAFSYSMMFLLTSCMIVYLRRSRTTVLKGDLNAVRKVILPSFEPLFWVISLVTGIYSAFFIVAAIINYTGPIQIRWFAEALVQGRQFILYLIMAFLHQRCVSRQALARSIGIALCFAIIPILAVNIMEYTEQSSLTNFIVMILQRAIIMGLFTYLFFRPISRASVQTQRELCLFAMIYYILVIIYSICFYQLDFKTGMMIIFCTEIWATLAPFFVWRLLKADTEHWRGFSDRACEFQHLFRENQGIQEIVSAQGLHVLLEIHREDFIDFAHLDVQRQIGIGASANVYRGVLHTSKQVAVKVYSPSEISEDTINEFSQEVALCSALKHPNIVTFHGMCICPPSICLIYELCRGSLDDALRKSSSYDFTEPLWPKLCYMLDAARAVAYLHSFSPPFIHRDLKPANFLLDSSNVVKLTDFGEARKMASKGNNVELNDARAMTIRGTAEYMAPEVIDGKQSQALYTETADIYSLAITMWDILHPGREKYPTSNNNHLNVYRMVIDGQRPPIDPEVPQVLHDLLENSWNADPRFRPSAKMVVAILEDIQENLCGRIAHVLATSVSYLAPTNSKKGSPPSILTGEALVRCLIEHGYVHENEGAIRLGNSLMDGGCLHHTKHTQPFENSAEVTYTFDAYQLELNEPLDDALTANEGSTQRAEGSVYTGASTFADGTALCVCRKLGQGHVKPKAPRRRLFGARKEEQAMLTVNLLIQSDEDMEFVEFSTSKSSGKRTLTMQLP